MARKKRQTSIPGTEPPSHQDVDEIAAQYVDVLYERMGLQEREPGLKGQLLERIKAHSLTAYKYEDGGDVYNFTLTASEKLSCKRVEAEE